MKDVPSVLIDSCPAAATFPVLDVHVLLDLEIPEADGALQYRETVW